jgi:hypothetical protein
MSFFDDFLRILRAPLDFMRGKTSLVRGAEGRVFGGVRRVQNLPREFKGELNYNRGLLREYKQRGERAKDYVKNRGKGQPGQPGQNQNGNGAPAAAPQREAKKKMGLFSKKRRCEGCGEKLDARWELCPYCGFGAGGGEPAQHEGGPPRTQALDISQQRDPYGGNQGYGGNQNSGGGKPRTMALDIGNVQQQSGPSRNQQGHLVAWLIPLDGPQGGQLLELRARAIVGTAPDCDVVVKDPSVSGRHAEFSAQGNVFRVNDLGSTNGTFVNDKRVTNAELVDGDTLRLGRTPFKFKST